MIVGEWHITFEDIDRLWPAYAAAFAEVNTLAAQRHLMTESEFIDVCRDARICKFIASDHGRPVGMSVATNRLEAWPLISPAYFERHYPEMYAERQIWYVGFVMAVQGAPTTTYRDLLDATLGPIRKSRGMAVVDFCGYNVNARNLDVATERILKRLEPSVRPTLIDAQRFITYEFDWPVP